MCKMQIFLSPNLCLSRLPLYQRTCLLWIILPQKLMKKNVKKTLFIWNGKNITSSPADKISGQL